MADKDIAEKMLLSKNDVFADIINVLVYNGERRVKPESLAECAAWSAYFAENKLHDLNRDIFKLWQESSVIKLALFGFENQTAPDKDMVIRGVGYDGIAYRAQMLADKKGEPKLRYPVITFVLYFGKEHWDAPVKLSERIKPPKELEPFFNDYKINLIEISYLTDEQVAMFESDFRVVAEYFVQTRKNEEYKPSNIILKHVEATMTLLKVASGDDKFVEALYSLTEEEKKEGIEVNKVLTRMVEEGEARGRAEGRAEGEVMGMLYANCKEEIIIERLKSRYSFTLEKALECIETARQIMAN